MSGDWVNEMFPGDGAVVVDVEEINRANTEIARWAVKWGEQPVVILRKHDGMATNRAYLRSKVRRWWYGKPVMLRIQRYEPQPPPKSITCPQCGRTSHNPNDVRERYCGNCHQYHSDMRKE